MDDALRRRIRDPRIRQRVRDADFQTWVKDHPSPNLQDYLGQYGSFSAIPLEAWRRFDDAVEQWQQERKHRLI